MCDHLDTCPGCYAAHQRSTDLYATGYEKGWKDAVNQIRRLARMNPFLSPTRAETLLSLLTRFHSQTALPARAKGRSGPRAYA